MGKSKKKEDSTNFSNPLESEDEEQGGGSGQTSPGSSPAMSASVALIVAAVAIFMALVAIAITPGSDDYVDKADYDALKATVVAMQSQSTDIAILETRQASDIAAVRSDITAVQSQVAGLSTSADVAAAVAPLAAASDVTALQTDVASLQSTVGGLPTDADVAAAVSSLAGNVVSAELTLDIDISSIAEGSDARAQFEADFKAGARLPRWLHGSLASL